MKRCTIAVVFAVAFLGGTRAGEAPATADAALNNAPRQILGKDVRGWIEHLAGHENAEERKLALICLYEFGPAAAPAVDELLTLLKDELQPETRRLSAEALGAIGPDAKRAVPKLLAVMQNPENPMSHRVAACTALAQIEPLWPSVRKALLAEIRGETEELRAAAILAAPNFGRDPDILAALSQQLLAGVDSHNIAQTLCCMNEAGIDPLVRGIERGSGFARKESAEALGRLREDAAAALPAILHELRQPQRTQADRAALLTAAAKIAPKNADVLKLLAENIALNPDIRELARARLLSRPEGLAAIRHGLLSPSAATRLEMLTLLGKLKGDPAIVPDLIARAQDADPAVRAAAVPILDAMGPLAAAAKEPLEHVAKTDPALERSASVAALNVSRPAGRPRFRNTLELLPESELFDKLRIGKPDERREAADALRLRSGPAVAKALTDALGDPDPKVKAGAARSLARFGSDAKPALETLTQWLEGENADLRKAALVALAGLGPDAKPALPALVKLALTPEPETDAAVRERLSIALRTIGPDSVPALVAELKNENAEARVRAARALAGMGAVAATAVPDLIELSRNVVESDARAVFDALGAIGPAAFPLASQYLAETLLTDLFAERRGWAATAIGAIGIPNGAPSRRVLDALQQALLDPDEGVCRSAHSALAHIGEPALPRLRELLKLGEGQASYWWAVRVMARLKADPDDVIPKLVELTQPGVRQVKEGAFAERGTAAELLGEYAPEHAEIVPLLVKLLGDRDEIVANAAARSLTRFGAPTLEPLKKALKSGSPLQRQRALSALEAVRDAEERRPALEQ